MVLGALLLGIAQAQAPGVSVGVDNTTGVYTVAVGGEKWYQSPAAPVVCVAGNQVRLLREVPAVVCASSPFALQVTLKLTGTKVASGSDKFGAWTGTMASYDDESGTYAAAVDFTFKGYASSPQLAVGTASFPDGLNTSGCGSNTALSTNFPAVDTGAARAPSLDTLSWRGGVIATTAAARGLGNLGAKGLDCGPVVTSDPATGNTIVWSTLDNHKVRGGRVRE
jgi:hypothetical protein